MLMSAQPLTRCEALGKALKFLEPQLLHLLNGNDRLCCEGSPRAHNGLSRVPGI